MSHARARRWAPTRISEPRTLNDLLGPPYVTLIHADHDRRVIKSAEEWDDDTEVLLIARDSDVAEMYRMKLEMDGYHVTRIDDLRDRKPSRSGWKPDLVMLDLGDTDAARLSAFAPIRSWGACRCCCSAPTPKRTFGAGAFRSGRPTMYSRWRSPEVS